jgi:exoribonuclease-2
VAGPSPGSVVAWWEHDAVAFGVVASEEKQRLVLIDAGGREARIPPTRLVATLATGPVPARTPEGRREAADRATDMAASIASSAAAVDVPTLWDLVRAAEGVLDEATLAELALARTDPPACLSTMIALQEDSVRFVRKGPGWQARSEQAVGELLAERTRVARRAEEKDATFRALAAAWSGAAWHDDGSRFTRRVLDALESLAVTDLDAPEKEKTLAMDAIAASGARGDRPSEAAFRLLRKTGRFASDDENLAIVRFGLRTEFDPATLAAADAAAARGFARPGRRDLTGVAALTIDDPKTREIDDALSITARGDGGFDVGIHIADPSAFIAPGDPIDLEARGRGTTYYFPERKLLMLPPVVSEDCASLVAGSDRPTLSFLVTVDAGGRIVAADIVRSIVRVAARLDYDEADAALRDGHGPHAAPLALLAAVAETREALRRGSGAVMLRAPETEIRVAADGSMTLTRRDPEAPAQRVVSEAMILAGEAAAGWLSSRGVPAIYRRQSPPDGRLPEPDPALPYAVHVRATRRLLKRGEAGLAPGAHHALGLSAYAQVTSPLRRYQDLAVQRQIVSVLKGEPPAHDAAAMLEILAGTERAENEGRRAERAMDRYWTLRWLARSAGETVTGVVVDVHPRPVVVLDETLAEQTVPALVGASIGDRVRLKVERVNPRADLLVLRPA